MHRVQITKRTTGAVLVLLLFVGPLNAQHATPVAWTNLVETSASLDGTLIKSAASVPGRASSAQRLGCGDGYLEFRAGGGRASIGLGRSAEGATSGTDFSLQFWGPIASVSESGSPRGGVPSESTDIFRIEIAGSSVLYKRNGEVFHTSERAALAYPLAVEASLIDRGATFRTVHLFAATEACGAAPVDVEWTDLVGTSASGSSLTTRSTAGLGGGASKQSINCGDGYVEYLPGGSGSEVGLSHGNDGVAGSEIDFAIRVLDGRVSVLEQGEWRTETGYAIGDVLRVEIATGRVLYKRNGLTFYANDAPGIHYPLVVDTSIPFGSSVSRATLLAAAGECAAIAWPNEPPGMVLHADWGLNQAPSASGDVPIDGSSGWHVVANAAPAAADGWAEHSSDPGAPFSPGGVYQFVYPTGMVEGTAPATVYTTFTADETYVGFWWKPSLPTYLGPNGVKVAMLFNGGGSGTGQQFLMLRPDGALHVLTEYPGDVNWRAPNVSASTVALGQWHLVEWYANRLTGEVSWWLDRALQGRHDDARNDRPFDMFQISPTWGGNTGAVKQSTDHYWFDHIHISTRTSGR